MNIQIFGRKKSNQTKKAQRFFSDRGIKFHFVDLDQKIISKGELDNIMSALKEKEELLNKDSKLYRSKFLYLQFDLFEELLSNQEMISIPIVRNGNKATVGYCPDTWKLWITMDQVQ
ncbi:MAG: ArsC family transcriptional regulator [Candidatus Delongbacteria bacterium]